MKFSTMFSLNQSISKKSKTYMTKQPLPTAGPDLYGAQELLEPAGLLYSEKEHTS